MKNLVSGIAIALLLGAIYTAPIQAQTYDGVTPAEETVCGVLLEPNADGTEVTKGLYGLCVAYCEAQDGLSYEEVGSYWTEYEYDTDDTLLQVYNKRKKETDPPMPCAVPLPSECPCFDKAFVDKIDGINDVTQLQLGVARCSLGTEVIEVSERTARNDFTTERIVGTSFPVVNDSTGIGCRAWIRSGGERIFYRALSVNEDQYYACRQIASTAPVCSGG